MSSLSLETQRKLSVTPFQGKYLIYSEPISNKGLGFLDSNPSCFLVITTEGDTAHSLGLGVIKPQWYQN